MRPVRLLAYSLQHIHTVRSDLTAYAFSAFACLAPSRPHTWVGFDTCSFFPLVWQGHGLPWSTVRLRGMGTGISEASKSVPIFDRGTGSKPERLRSGFLQADLSLIVYHGKAPRLIEERGEVGERRVARLGNGVRGRRQWF